MTDNEQQPLTKNELEALIRRTITDETAQQLGYPNARVCLLEMASPSWPTR